MRTLRELASIGVAAALHAGVVGVLATRAPAIAEASVIERPPIEVELLMTTTSEAPATTRSEATAPSDDRHAESHFSGLRAIAPRGAEVNVPLIDGPAAPGDLVFSPRATASATTDAPKALNFDLPRGAFGAPADPGEAKTAAITPRIDDGSKAAEAALRAPGEAHDKFLGLGVGGAVATAVRNAAISTKDAPFEGSAELEIVTNAAGMVTAVRVVSGSPSPGAYQSVANATHAALGGRPLRVPEGTNGMIVRIHVEAKRQMPSGRKVGDGPVQLNGAGLGFDLADIGASATRIVSSRVVSEARL